MTILRGRGLRDARPMTYASRRVQIASKPNTASRPIVDEHRHNLKAPPVLVRARDVSRTSVLAGRSCCFRSFSSLSSFWEVAKGSTPRRRLELQRKERGGGADLTSELPLT